MENGNPIASPKLLQAFRFLFAMIFFVVNIQGGDVDLCCIGYHVLFCRGHLSSLLQHIYNSQLDICRYCS